MDRTYVAPEAACGEIRLIYRLTRINKAAGDAAAPPRLPMTLNLVLKAKGEGSANHLRRDRQALAYMLPLVKRCSPTDGPLDLIGYENIDRIETNLQIAHAPKSSDARLPHRLSAEGVSL